MLPHDEIEKFLERPVLIHTTTLSLGSPLTNVHIHPWHLFFSSSPIKKKIDNYAFINCTLHVKFVINASPFYSGAMLVSYVPMTGYSTTIASSAIEYIPYSQRPHVWILPQNNQGGDLTLPFFFPRNWLDITSDPELTDMGELSLLEIVPLAHSNGAASGAVNVQAYAWASDVKLSGPTTKLAVQAGQDEYGQGPVSKVATTVANIASKLLDVPLIAPFAKATEIGARAVGGIASLFGYTNVPVISNVMPVKNLPFHSLASTEIGEPVNKLTLDPKNELTIDPRTTGIGGGDELSIAYLVGRESLLTTVTWSNLDSYNTNLFTSGVNPMLYDRIVQSDQTLIQFVPMAIVASCFQYWRGDIIFRFKAICTQYHKGRVRVTWDPIDDIYGNHDTNTTSFNKVYDLAPDLDFEVRISYLQATQFRTVPEPSNARSFSKSGDLYISQINQYNNGMLTLRVLNELSGPTSDCDITFLVFVRGAENLTFSNPRNQLGDTFSPFEVQSGADEEHCADSIVHAHNCVQNPNASKVYGGEEVKSLRVLLRRSECAPGFSSDSNGGNTAGTDYCQYRFTKFPPSPGYDPKSYTNAVGIVSGIKHPFSWGYNTVFSKIIPCFVGMRGSIIWHFNVDTKADLTTLRVDRFETQIPSSNGRVVEWSGAAITNGTDQRDLRLELYRRNLPSGETGMNLSNLKTQTGVSVLLPHYHNSRFVGTNPAYFLTGHNLDGTSSKHYRLTQFSNANSVSFPFNGNYVHRMFSVGPDFNCFFFIGVPTWYMYSAVPVATSTS